MTLPLHAKTLSAGHSIVWVWHSGVDPTCAIPVGFIDTHGDSCRCFVPWVSGLDDAQIVTLVSLNPLTIEEMITCPTCGASWLVRDNNVRPCDA